MKKREKRSVKTIFYAILIGFAVISFWRGIWGLMDLYLFPNNLALSFFASVFIGLIILFLTKHLFDELI